MVAEMVKLRKGKMTDEQVRAALSKSNYFGTMLVKNGWSRLSVRWSYIFHSRYCTSSSSAHQNKTRQQHRKLLLHLVRGDEKIAMGDCAINIDPSEDDLVEIAIESAKTAKIFGIDPKVAMLSYSTLGSGKGPSVTKVANATKKIKEAAPELAVEGEIQFDASVSPEVAEVKCPGSPVAGQANTFIFPDINAANIGYKIASRLGGYTAVGPVLQGLNAPINDLSVDVTQKKCTACLS